MDAVRFPNSVFIFFFLGILVRLAASLLQVTAVKKKTKAKGRRTQHGFGTCARFGTFKSSVLPVFAAALNQSVRRFHLKLGKTPKLDLVVAQRSTNLKTKKGACVFKGEKRFTSWSTIRQNPNPVHDGVW